MAEALALSREERELLLAVALTEQDRQFTRVENALGISWSLADLVGITDKKKKPKKRSKDDPPEKLPSQIRVPLLLALAPEFFEAIGKDYRRKWNAMTEAQRISGGGPVVDLATLSPEQAREFYKRIGGMIAKAQPAAEEK